MKQKIIIIAVVLGLATVVGFRLASNKEKIEENNKVVDRSKIEVPVTTVKTKLQAVNTNFSLPAETEADLEVDLALKTSGILQSLKFDVGSKVRKGQYLGGVDVAQLQLNLEATELLLKKSERDYNNLKDLYEEGAASENEYINAKYNFENNQIQVNQIKQQIADGSVTAPISGTIVTKSAESGEFVSPGQPIATIVDVSRLKAVVMVSESEAYQLEEEGEVKIITDVYPEKTFTGKISFISPKGNENHNYPVEVEIENDEAHPLKAGTFVQASFNVSDSTELLSVPKVALVEGVKNPYVYVVQNGKAVRKNLVLGRMFGESVEVKEGLNEREEVIISGQINLTEGSLVEVIN